ALGRAAPRGGRPRPAGTRARSEQLRRDLVPDAVGEQRSRHTARQLLPAQGRLRSRRSHRLRSPLTRRPRHRGRRRLAARLRQPQAGEAPMIKMPKGKIARLVWFIKGTLVSLVFYIVLVWIVVSIKELFQ